MATATALRSETAATPKRARMPRGKSQWYLVHAPKREQATCDKLRKVVSPDFLDDAFVLRKERWRKQGGEWQCSIVPLYQDYFFVATKDAAALDRQLAKLSFPARIAKGDGRTFVPFSPEAQEWYEGMMDDAHVIRSSVGVIVDGALQLQEGPLVGHEASVIQVNRPKRTCFVSVDDGENGMRECVPLVIPFKS
ncbi:MAG: hypothetical protein Q3963_04290 [Coriobacteriaceae bacterium]|nr:hypothetical protein [Coriobacteriaceae bacterium]